ncbi:Type II transport protein GspH [compost metagenome]
MVIFASFALPGFSQLVKANRVQSTASELATFLQYARSEAVTRNVDITAAASNGVWSIKQGSTTLRVLDNQQSALSIQPATVTLTFYPNGTASASTSIYVCQGDDTSTGYLLSVKASGQIKLWPRGKESATTPLGSCGT